MKNQYMESFIPFGIGTSFMLILIVLLGLGALVGYLIGDRPPFNQLGGIGLLTVFLVVFVGPLIYNRTTSRFESGRTVLDKCDGMGLIQGLRGALFRLIVYEDGLEIRAFYHRYFIPYSHINHLDIEEGLLRHRLNIETDLEGLPQYLVANDKKFLALFRLIETKVRTGGAWPA
jgi:membrane protein YdbS with pleckstrin-like domain